MRGFGRKRQPSLMRKEGWRQFVDDPLLSAREIFGPREEWQKCAKRDREAFDIQRSDHHASFVIETPRMKEIHDHLWNQARANYGAVGARPGSVIDALSGGYGKTWMMIHFGRAYERGVRELPPLNEPRPNHIFDRTPVVYIALRDSSSETAIDEDFLRFFGRPFDGIAKKDLVFYVEEVAWDCETSVVFVDDVMNLRAWRKNDTKIAKHLNHLASRVPATFVYAGINCVESGVFDEGDFSFAQDSANTSTQCRFTHLLIEPFALDVEWQALLRSFENELVLLKGYEGMLCVDLAEYLYERTGGVIGSISQLLRRAADLAVLTGTERITEKLLKQESIWIDRAAEKRAAQTSSKKRGKAAKR